MKCERCKADSFSTIMSRFNSEAICKTCETAEQRHPNYRKAVAVEAAALLSGDTNYPGTGFENEPEP